MIALKGRSLIDHRMLAPCRATRPRAAPNSGSSSNDKVAGRQRMDTVKLDIDGATRTHSHTPALHRQSAFSRSIVVSLYVSCSPSEPRCVMLNASYGA